MKGNSKRALVFMLLFIILITGCGQTKTALDPKKPVTITLWHYYAGESLVALEEAVHDFNQTLGMQKGVIVEAIALGSLNELEKSITSSAKGEINSMPLPDIFSCYPDKALEIDAYHQLLDFNKYFTDQEKAEYIPAFLEDGYFSGQRLLVLPIVKSTELLYLNQTAWQDFCPHKDVCLRRLAHWEGLYETARQYYQWVDAKTPEIPWDGKGFLGIDALANFIVVANRQQGVEILGRNIDGEGQVILNKLALKRIFDIYYQGYSLGYFDAVGRFCSDDIKTGDLIAYVGSSAGALYFPTWVVEDNSKREIELLALPYPVFSGEKNFAIQQGAGMCVVPSDAAHQEGSVLFLKWFTAGENNIAFAGQTGYLPVKQETFALKVLAEVIEELSGGTKVEKNVAKVLSISLGQIVDMDTYAIPPFPESYNARKLLQSTLLDISEAGRQRAQALQKKALSEEEVLQGINSDLAYAEWLASLEEGLLNLAIPFQDE